MYDTIKKQNISTFLLELAEKCIELINSNKSISVDLKNDGSPVSNIDLEVDKLIKSNLKKLNFRIPIISEESFFNKIDFLDELYWIIDPIDGTKSFIRGGEEFTVNVALIHKGMPMISMICHPPSNKIWIGQEDKLEIYHNMKMLNFKKYKPFWEKPIIITSRYNNDKTKKFIGEILSKNIIYMSSSLKFCELVESKANLYPRLSIINKWDIAAGHGILKSVGGVITNTKGHEIRYDTPSEKISEFIASDTEDWLNRV